MLRRIRAIAWLAGLAMGGACAAPFENDDPGPAPGSALRGDTTGVTLFSLDVSHWEGPMSQWEMDCFWRSGVRHIISGTQVEEVTRQQLRMAVSRGMTVDAYVYLFWNEDMTAQVERALARIRGLPVGRLWLDVENDPGGRRASELIDLLAQAVGACRAQGLIRCGIYTRGSYWRERLGNTTRFSDVPLWYALYNYRTSLSSFGTERFGGWTTATGKQWAEESLCDVGVDKNTMRVQAAPTVVVNRTPPVDDGRPPSAPSGLYPENGSVTRLSYLKLMSATVPLATSYSFEVQSWNGRAWVAYYTWWASRPFKRISPAYLNRIYRFRVRARNARGDGPWSAWSQFDLGTYTGPRPGASQPPSGPPATPTDLAPNGTTETAAAVSLSCRPVPAATRYEFTIEHAQGTGFAPYYTYATSTPAKTFYPRVHATTYRWRVRAQAGSAWSGWSAHATFRYP